MRCGGCCFVIVVVGIAVLMATSFVILQFPLGQYVAFQRERSDLCSQHEPSVCASLTNATVTANATAIQELKALYLRYHQLARLRHCTWSAFVWCPHTPECRHDDDDFWRFYPASRQSCSVYNDSHYGCEYTTYVVDGKWRSGSRRPCDYYQHVHYSDHYSMYVNLTLAERQRVLGQQDLAHLQEREQHWARVRAFDRLGI